VLEVTIDRGRCQGAAECVHVAPDSFRLDRTARAVVVEPPGDAEEILLEAACACPNSAVVVSRDGVEIDAWATSEGGSHA
jgi:ferredoxin